MQKADILKNKSTTILKCLILIIGFSFYGCTSAENRDQLNRDRNFNAGWKFIRDSIAGAETPGFDDSGWLTVDLPHDFSLMELPGGDNENQVGPFSKNSPGNGNATGHFMGGTGWYRKSFVLNKADKDKTVVLNFDGVYEESEIWVNGQKAGEHKNGYTPFWFDITDMLNPPGERNVVAVKVENLGRNSRWYSGSGIYRNVRLTLTGPLHVKPWGVYITTPEVRSGAATAHVEVTVQNDLTVAANTQLTINIKDANDNLVAAGSAEKTIAENNSEVIKTALDIQNPQLWSVEAPHLYTAEIIVKADGEETDRYSQPFGIRSISFSAEKGFLLNGQPLLLKGGCVHHDNGLLGAAAFERAEERKVELLKARGFNAIRFSHNPPSKVFLDACDRLGMLVINEFTDMWEHYKNPQDYSEHFKEWWNRDLTNWLLRDRNHPSIIMWSIGNEIHEPDADTRLRIAKQLADRTRELDPTRAVTMGVTGFFYSKGWETTAPVFDLLDVCGYNYMLDKIESDHEKYPDRVIYMSESYTKSAYDYWKAVEKHPYVIGDFIWTAWDYLGEVSIGRPNYVPESQDMGFMGNFSNFTLPEGVNIFDIQAGRPSNWPYFHAFCGDIDITGEKAPQMLYRDVIWGNSDIEINVHEPIPEGMAEFGMAWAWPFEYPHWNWEGNENRPLQVRVFTRADRVRLELNGETVGEKTLTEDDKYIAEFNVPYQPGELKAVALGNGQEMAAKILKTSLKPAAIRLVAERNEIHADKNDLSFIKIEVVDQNGQLVPDASNAVQITVEGHGKLIASGNADPKDMKSFNRPEVKVFRGKAQAIVRPTGDSGQIKVLAESKGLNRGEIIIGVQ